MKLDRNINPDGKGKYALVKLRVAGVGGVVKLDDGTECGVIPLAAIDYGDTPETEFFVIRLKDKYAASALLQYAKDAGLDDPEYASEIMRLAEKSLRMEARRPD